MKRKFISGMPKADVMQAIGQTLNESTITSEANLAVLLAESLSLVLNDIDRRTRDIYATAGVIVKKDGNDNILTGLSRYCNAAKMAAATYERDLRDRFQKYTFDFGGAESYDSFSRSANSIVRLNMLLVDRGKRDGVLDKVESYIKRFKPQGRFNDADYERFVLK